MTMTSRGSRLGSSWSMCRIASRATSTWRARPWQAWTCTLRSSRIEQRARVRRRSGSGSPGRGAVGAHVGLDPRPAACRRHARRGGGDRRGRRPSPTTSCSSRASCPHEASRLLAGSVAVDVVGAAHDRRQLRARGGDLLPQHRATGAAGTGARRGARRARAAPRAARRAGASARTATAAAAGRRGPARRAAARTPPRAARPGPAIAMRSRSRRHSSACQSASSGSARPCRRRPRARAQARTISRPVQRVAIEQLGDVTDRAQPPRAPRVVGLVVARAEVRGEALPSTARPGSPRRHRAAATPRARPATGRRPARRPTPPPPHPPRAGAATGTRRSRTPRRRGPRVTPRQADMRCVSQRSIPRVGTAMTSGANGSAQRRRAAARASASTRPSARSAR